MERSLLLPINCHSGLSETSQYNPGGKTQQHNESRLLLRFSESLINTDSVELSGPKYQQQNGHLAYLL